MLKTVLSLCITLTILLTCCSIPERSNSPLNTDNLKSELVTIDLTKDTTLITSKGARIFIPEGALEAVGKLSVQLEIKEAYSLADIINAGLTTSSNGQPLSSGGMIYFNAVGENKVKITKAISISVPSGPLNEDMQLFKGQTNKDGTINWTDPSPIFPVEQGANIEAGESLFINNCASCHAIGRPLTGPDLAHVSKRKDKQWLFAFTRNSQQVIASGDYYANCLFNQWNKSAMTTFTDITDESLEALYSYIENESNKRHLPLPLEAGCLDSCAFYYQQYSIVYEARQQILAGNEKRVQINSDQNQAFLQKTGNTDPEYIKPENKRSLYYQFKIESFGWYNIDMLIKVINGVEESELEVRVRGEYKQSITLYLIIPSWKVFVEGSLLNDKKDQFGFYTREGKIPLPQNVQAYIIALSESSEGIIFSKKEFTTRLGQQFELKTEVMSKEQFQQQIASMSVGDLGIEALDSKYANELRSNDKRLQEIELLKPRNCDCSCFPLKPTSSDTSISKP